MNLVRYIKEGRKTTKSSHAVVFGVTKDLDFALGAMIVGFLKHNEKYDGHFVVFHDGISQEQQDVFCKIYESISFRRFEAGTVRNRLAKVMDPQSASKIIDRYSHLYFAKFEIFDILDEFERVIWMDVDMLVRAPVCDLWDFDDFCWRETADGTRKKQTRMYEEFEDEIKGAEFRTPNGGLIGVSKKAAVNYRISSDTVYMYFGQFRKKFDGVQGDEFAMFMCAAANRAAVKLLDGKEFNCPSATTGAQNAKIIHAVGKDKFWNNHALKLAYPDWWMWYNEWERLGGRKATGKMSGGGAVKTPNGLVYSARFEHHWKSLFSSVWDKLPAGYIPDVLMHRKFYQIFLSGFPQKQLHVEIIKLDKGFELCLHVEGEATENTDLINVISSRMTALADYERADHRYGLGWRIKCAPAALSREVIRLANALQDLKTKQP